MIEVFKFKPEHVVNAAKLFVEGYKRLGKTYLDLPSKYGDLYFVGSKLVNIIKENPSFVAVRNGELIGYLTGFANIPSLKGRSMGVYIPEWAHGSINTKDKEKIYSKLYSHLSKIWIAEKNYTHLITYYGEDVKLNAQFHKFGFGLLVIDGYRTLTPLKINDNPAFYIRQAKKEDLRILSHFNELIYKHLRDAPTFLYSSPSQKSLEEIEKNFLGSNRITFVAEHEGKIVSIIRAMLNEGPGCEVVQDTGTLGVNFGYTLPEMRGSGIASLVLNKLIEWGKKNDMKRCVVDFESQNIEAYNFWLRYFQPICYSGIRKIDDRIE
ncbi:N-acetyltransferase family protein [Candidatus Lokiarchaeum ossiferum]|uniref:N-acetyltransferase family protein n=1 Tax=Candidatus Lokiarchaeum ossiferum TaxID=2951803 RepID=UPI00352C6ED3